MINFLVKELRRCTPSIGLLLSSAFIIHTYDDVFFRNQNTFDKNPSRIKYTFLYNIFNKVNVLTLKYLFNDTFYMVNTDNIYILDKVFFSNCINNYLHKYSIMLHRAWLKWY